MLESKIGENGLGQSQDRQQPTDGTTQSQFSINVREHFCIALAIATWGPLLTDPLGLNTVHVEILTDNTSALAWSTSLVSSNSYSQELNRWFGLHQAMHQLHVSSRYIQGVLNTNPDPGSRALREP
ncbi:hypothetical protein H257_12265 [Aphanomyces astaci]|uniref:RNase H type-1 domain-containing protein n=1 Tax=Aphanomyces astaci TaxID=112090 RepID=W4FZN6_APHAT|nr:hypothetical protein H257_12265 [Aphanomyces astaci]ETV72935.1 hypothetical protein H257_12265 [Aphanomyces astaci]|eukprot:XP_009837721.1 hypothetical protein H257_12265 [Aphanomyces astaci]